jgi:uncharacterized protein YbaP (TraB family)
MPIDRRRALLVLITGAFALPAAAGSVRKSPNRFARGLLWRVARPGVAPSYVFGTIHLADPRVLDFPEPVTLALSRSLKLRIDALEGIEKQGYRVERAY